MITVFNNRLSLFLLEHDPSPKCDETVPVFSFDQARGHFHSPSSYLDSSVSFSHAVLISFYDVFVIATFHSYKVVLWGKLLEPTSAYSVSHLFGLCLDGWITKSASAPGKRVLYRRCTLGRSCPSSPPFTGTALASPTSSSNPTMRPCY